MSKEFFFQLTTQEAINAIAERVLQVQSLQTAPAKEVEIEEAPITIEEACQFLRISKPTLHSWMGKGQIPFHRKGRRVFLFKSEIVESLQKPAASGKRRF